MAAATGTLTPRTLAGLKVVPVQKRSPFLNILVYGKSGVGKTVLAGSADEVPSMRPVLFVDVEGGTESLRNKYPNVDTVRIVKWSDMNDLYTELGRGKHGYRTVVLDSLTEIQKFNMYEIMRGVVSARPDLDIDVPSVREWGRNLEQMRRFVRYFRDLPMHTVFTALQNIDKDNKTGALLYKPQLSGKLADEVAGFLDVVLFMYVKQLGGGEGGQEEFKRLLLTHATDQHIAKDRTGNLPLVVEDPNMLSLHKLMYPVGEEDNIVEQSEERLATVAS